MLEIVSKNDSGGGCDFAQKMVDLQTKTIINVFNLACKYGVDPFEVLKIFGTHLIENAADMRADFRKKQKNESDDTEI